MTVLPGPFTVPWPTRTMDTFVATAGPPVRVRVDACKSTSFEVEPAAAATETVETMDRPPTRGKRTVPDDVA